LVCVCVCVCVCVYVCATTTVESHTLTLRAARLNHPLTLIHIDTPPQRDMPNLDLPHL